MPEPASAAAALGRVPFFGHLEPSELHNLVECGRRRSVESGAVVFRQGDAPDGMYVVLAGTVKLTRRESDGVERQVALFEPGGFFGEPALLEGRPRTLTAIALEPCEFFILDRDEFLGRLKRSGTDALVRVLGALSRTARETSERMWERELAHTRTQAELEIQRHRALSQMVAGVAHELNTPLGLAHSSADLIERRCGAGALAESARDDPGARAVLDDVAEACALLRRNLTRAHALVESFKQLSVRQLSEVEERIDVADVVRDAVELFGPSARDAGLDVHVDDRRNGEAREWTGTPSKLTQVILNLLSNAARYAYDAGGTVEIAIEDAELSGAPAVGLTVRDFGRGISPEHLDRVFDPFFTTGRGRGGTGLGLAIVHGLITSAMGGAIRVESSPGAGAAFRAALPLRRPHMS